MNFNPVLMKELKVRMRGWRAMGMVTAYLIILTLVVMFYLMNTIGNPYSSMLSKDNTIGIYSVLTSIQFMLIAFIAPALTSGSISGERERQTLDLLLCTRMRSISIIFGKLFSSISVIILLVAASLPILSIVLLFGGISFGNIFQLFLFQLIVAITLGSIGIFFSTHLNRTTAATVLTYAVIIFLLLGTLFLSVFYIQLKYRGQSIPTNIVLPLMYFNPGAGFASLLAEQFGISGSSFMLGVFSSGIASSVPFWISNTMINIAISIILITLSAFKIDPARKKVSFLKNIRK